MPCLFAVRRKLLRYCGSLIFRVLVSGLLKSRLGLHGESGKARGVVGGNVSEDLAIEAIAGELEAIDKGRVAHAIVAAGCIDTDDPEGAILALLLFAAGV